jgi:hypothetical protein
VGAAAECGWLIADNTRCNDKAVVATLGLAAIASNEVCDIFGDAQAQVIAGDFIEAIQKQESDRCLKTECDRYVTERRFVVKAL